jgi:hypothetical protein
VWVLQLHLPEGFEAVTEVLDRCVLLALHAGLVLAPLAEVSPHSISMHWMEAAYQEVLGTSTRSKQHEEQLILHQLLHLLHRCLACERIGATLVVMMFNEARVQTTTTVMMPSHQAE